MKIYICVILYVCVIMKQHMEYVLRLFISEK